MIKHISFSIITLIIMTASVFAVTYYVPGDFNTIQDAIDMTVNGDEVLVGPGTYFERIDYGGKNISIASTDGPEVTIINGQYNGSTVSFISGETRDALFTGFTVTGGTGTPTETAAVGGGILCRDESSPTLRNLIITGNQAYATNSLAAGGGIAFSTGSDALFENSIIEENLSNYGGGIGIYFSNPTIKNLVIRNNSTNYGGGGGLFIQNSDVIVEDITFYGNHGFGGGGAIHVHGDCRPILNKLIMVDNIAGPTNGGGAIVVSDGAHPRLINSIAWGNSMPEIELWWQSGWGFAGADITVAYSDVMGGENEVVVDTYCELFWLDHNINELPCFVDPDENDYRLLPESPCIDAGAENFIFDDGLIFEYSEEYWYGLAPDFGDWEFTYLLGDINDDDDIDVIDIVTLVNFILSSDPEGLYQFWSSDLNGDEILDVLDVVQLVNLILAGPVQRVDMMGHSKAQINMNGGDLSISADNYIAGFQIDTISNIENVQIDCPVGWQCLSNGNIVLGYSPDGSNLTQEIYGSYSNQLEYSAITISDANGHAMDILGLPESFVLGQAFPNPFNPIISIPYSLEQDTHLKLNIYDLKGSLVGALVNQVQPAGSYQMTWDASNHPSGLYILKFEAGHYQTSQKIFLLK